MSRQRFEIGEQISHVLWLYFKAGHRRCLTTHNLVNDLHVLAPVAYSFQARPYQALACDAMAAGAIDAEQFTAVFGGSMDKRCFGVGILASVAQHPYQQNDASHRRKNGEGRNETSTPLRNCCSS